MNDKLRYWRKNTVIKLSPISDNLKKEYFEKISEDFEIFLESLKDKENTQDLNEIKITEYKREVLKIYKYLEDSNFKIFIDF